MQSQPSRAICCKPQHMTRVPQVVAVGSALVDEQYQVSNLPEPDGGAYVYEESLAFGGVAANVAVALSRLGRSTGVIVCLGDDAKADEVKHDLRKEDVAIDQVRTNTDTRSTYCMVFCDPNGERTIITCGGAAKDLTLVPEDDEYLRSADLVFANSFCPNQVTQRLSTLSMNGEIKLAFDLASPLKELEGRGTERDTLDDLLPHLSLFTANKISINSYLGVQGEEAVDLLRKRGVRRGALTSGEHGALLWDCERSIDIPALDVEVVDTTGAGDAFSSGLIHKWLLERESIENAGRFAAAAGGYNCTKKSARGGMDDEEQIEAFLNSCSPRL
ncbi:carbohydrate kinase family protein [Halomontanus rarus]|uniref:carbohydrate kinase family protein n=1 Tax=Halomontanus rarus TaxID=3034020 RepID=UPI00307B47F4